MTDLERAREVFRRTTFAAETVGCVIDAVDSGYARCSLPLDERHMNALGTPMGGAVFTLADYAFGVASNFDRDVFLSTSADIHFLGAPKGKTLIAEAREIRSGRRTCLYEVTVTDELGVQVAYVTVAGMLTMVRKKKQK